MPTHKLTHQLKSPCPPHPEGRKRGQIHQQLQRRHARTAKRLMRQFVAFGSKWEV